MVGIEQLAYAGGMAFLALAYIAKVKWKNVTLTILFFVLACVCAVVVKGQG